MIRTTVFLAAFGALAACGERVTTDLPALGKTFLGSVYQTEGFRPAPINVLAPARAEMRTLRLRPCGDTVCGSRAGQVSMTADGAVITGAYRGVTLTLAPGGGGTLSSGGRTSDIVWDFAE